MEVLDDIFPRVETVDVAASKGEGGLASDDAGELAVEDFVIDGSEVFADVAL